MSDVAQEEPDRMRLAELLRRRRAEATDAHMLQRLQVERRLHAIDMRMTQLNEMKAMLVSKLGSHDVGEIYPTSRAIEQQEQIT
jgi:hypothetical protein